MKLYLIILLLFIFKVPFALSETNQCQNLFLQQHSTQQLNSLETHPIQLMPKEIKDFQSFEKKRIFHPKQHVLQFVKDLNRYIQSLTNQQLIQMIEKHIQKDPSEINMKITKQEDYKKAHMKLTMLDYFQNISRNPNKDRSTWAYQFMNYFIGTQIYFATSDRILVGDHFAFRVMNSGLIAELFSRIVLAQDKALIKRLFMIPTGIVITPNSNSVKKATTIESTEEIEQNKKYQDIIQNYLNKSNDDPYLKQQIHKIDQNDSTSLRIKVKKISDLFNRSERIKIQEEAFQKQRQSSLQKRNSKVLNLEQNIVTHNHQLELDHRKNNSQSSTSESIRSTQELLRQIFHEYPQLAYLPEFWLKYDEIQNKTADNLYLLAKDIQLGLDLKNNKNSEQQNSDQIIVFSKSAQKEFDLISEVVLKRHVAEFLELLKSNQWLQLLEHDRRWDYHMYSHPHPIYGDHVRTVDAGRKGTRIVFRVKNKNEFIILGINADKIHMK